MRAIIEKGPKDKVDEALIASVLRQDYRLPPWNEDRMCPKCKKEDDFGPGLTYGSDYANNHCPQCGHELTPYWSDERIGLYLQLARQKPNFLFLEVQESEKLAGWLWGYDISLQHKTSHEPSFYIDVFAVVPEFRGIQQSTSCVRQGFSFLRRHEFKKLPNVMKNKDIPVCGLLFLKLAHSQWLRGYTRLLTRTHKEAVHVKSLLRGAGFVKTSEATSSDPRRHYWMFTFT